jgi:carbamoyl-phosphate synthase large subunit
VDTGGSNVQFAVNPADGRMLVIEMNPRVSRSSALASKATGFPIAKVAAKLAVGYTLDELSNDITGGATPASFEPTIDYVVTKVPRFAFEKFKQADDRLTTQMKSVGEVMAIGRTFQESLQKALRGLETGVDGFNLKTVDPEKIGDELAYPRAERLWYVADAFGVGMPVDEVYRYTKIDPWFLAQIKEIVDTELALEKRTLAELDEDDLRGLKRMGFADRRIAYLLKVREGEVRSRRHELGIRPVFKRVDTCACGVRDANRLSLLDVRRGMRGRADRSEKGDRSGRRTQPHRPGNRVRLLLRARGDGAAPTTATRPSWSTCNPETVSTDYDTSDRLYFEPLTLEDVPRDRPRGETVRRHRPVRRADAAQARARPRGERRADHRHLARHDRHGGGPRALPADAAPARAPAAVEPDRAHREGRDERGGGDRAIRWSYVRRTCWAAARWRSSTSRRTSSATCARR